MEQPRRPEPRPGVKEAAQRHRKVPLAGKGQSGSVPGLHVLNQDLLGLNHTPPRGDKSPNHCENHGAYRRVSARLAADAVKGSDQPLAEGAAEGALLSCGAPASAPPPPPPGCVCALARRAKQAHSQIRRPVCGEGPASVLFPRTPAPSTVTQGSPPPREQRGAADCCPGENSQKQGR